jgi:hypothetical protein
MLARSDAPHPRRPREREEASSIPVRREGRALVRCVLPVFYPLAQSARHRSICFFVAVLPHSVVVELQRENHGCEGFCAVTNDHRDGVFAHVNSKSRNTDV